jgi:hypothetical protein
MLAETKKMVFSAALAVISASGAVASAASQPRAGRLSS